MSELIEWINSKDTIEKSKKSYAHFDLRTDISKCQSYIINPQKIATHGFYPFIHYEQIITKYHKRKGKKKKVRDICYASHIDRCIFQLYSHIINELYNEEVKHRGIDSVSVAYRTDFKSDNIHISKKAFDFIREFSPCYVIIGDFTGFFDNINHNYLKTLWCNLLGVKYLPDDHYAVFKNITRYSKWELSDICKINGLENNKNGRKELNSKRTILTKWQFKKHKSQIIKNPHTYGIPQGSSISAVLANLYMIDVDTEINRIVTNVNGLYMRYSDDFIIVLPINNKNFSSNIVNKINEIFNSTVGLTLEPSKTQYYKYDNKQIKDCGKLFNSNSEESKKTIDYLGFSFDGLNVTIRPKTISKYYYRMNKKAKTITKSSGYSKNGKKISKENLYKRYSIKGAFIEKGNFLTYVERAKSCYVKEENIDKNTRNHMQKIKKALNKNSK